MANVALSRFDGPHRTGWVALALPRPETVLAMRSGWLLLAFVAAACSGTARAESVAANLQVSVQVLPHARLQGDDSRVTITATDIQRGYHDVSRHYRLRTNAPDRVVLQLNPRLGLTDSIEIQGFQAPVRMSDASLEISQPWEREFTLSYRLWLSSRALPGAYELPVHVSAVLR